MKATRLLLIVLWSSTRVYGRVRVSLGPLLAATIGILTAIELEMTPQGRHARYITTAVDGGIRRTRQRAADHLAISDTERGDLKLLENTDMKRNPRRAVRPQSRVCQ